MDFKTAMRISGAGLTAHRAWMNVSSVNLANAQTTKTSAGEPYRRRTLVYESVPVEEEFGRQVDQALDEGIESVRVERVVADKRDFVEVYDPYHPDADENGIVLMPNVRTSEEMANLLMAARGYEANLVALSTAKQLALKAIDIGK